MDAQPKILIVEDDAIIAMDLRSTLEESGFRVFRPRATGEAAVQFAASECPNLVLMDIHLAGEMDGIEAARLILEVCPIGLIFISGYLNPEVVAEAGVLKPFAFLGKPVILEDLLETIRRWQEA